MAEEESMELISFGIVASAGQARSLAMEAIAQAREGDIEGAPRRSRSRARSACKPMTSRPSSCPVRPVATTCPWTCCWFMRRTI